MHQAGDVSAAMNTLYLICMPSQCMPHSARLDVKHSDALVASSSQEVVLITVEAEVSDQLLHAMQLGRLGGTARLPQPNDLVCTCACQARTRPASDEMKLNDTSKT